MFLLLALAFDVPAQAATVVFTLIINYHFFVSFIKFSDGTIFTIIDE